MIRTPLSFLALSLFASLAFSQQVDGKKIVIQCKYYGQPVGNKSVQEAYTAKAHHRADHAVVVTNSTYTNAAQQLALTSGVLLLHHEALSVLDNRLSNPAVRSSGIN